jgi:hypothetical protein
MGKQCGDGSLLCVITYSISMHVFWLVIAEIFERVKCQMYRDSRSFAPIIFMNAYIDCGIAV